MSKKKSHARAPGMTQISISLPQRLVDKIDRLAKKEKRSRSNFISFLLESINEEPFAVEESAPVFLQAAEPKEAFKTT